MKSAHIILWIRSTFSNKVFSSFYEFEVLPQTKSFYRTMNLRCFLARCLLTSKCAVDTKRSSCWSHAVFVLTSNVLLPQNEFLMLPLQWMRDRCLDNASVRETHDCRLMRSLAKWCTAVLTHLFENVLDYELTKFLDTRWAHPDDARLWCS